MDLWIRGCLDCPGQSLEHQGTCFSCLVVFQVLKLLTDALHDGQIHVDDYKLGVYKSLRVTIGDNEFLHLSPEAPALTGFTRGNDVIDGILTQDYSVRLHSCEKGTHCPRMKKGNVVFITPIVTHLSDENDLLDIGIGGGGGDLEQLEEELVISAEEARQMLEK